jgi:aminoglycoside phosphotransferase (APT) family kinase protein
MVYWSDRDDPRDVASAGLSPLTAQDGFLTRAELVDAYARRSARSLDLLPWYVALGYYKLSIVAEGIHARFLMGMTVGEGFEQYGPKVPVMVDWALRLATDSGLPGLRG